MAFPLHLVPYSKWKFLPETQVYCVSAGTGKYKLVLHCSRKCIQSSDKRHNSSSSFGLKNIHTVGNEHNGRAHMLLRGQPVSCACEYTDSKCVDVGLHQEGEKGLSFKGL